MVKILDAESLDAESLDAEGILMLKALDAEGS